MNAVAHAGFGDAPYRPTGHPHDPMTLELDDDAAELVTMAATVAAQAARAQAALANSDYETAAHALDEIRAEVGPDPELVATIEAIVSEAGVFLPPHLLERARRVLKGAA